MGDNDVGDCPNMLPTLPPMGHLRPPHTRHPRQHRQVLLATPRIVPRLAVEDQLLLRRQA